MYNGNSISIGIFNFQTIFLRFALGMEYRTAASLSVRSRTYSPVFQHSITEVIIYHIASIKNSTALETL